jgi:hypothetical protein
MDQVVAQALRTYRKLARREQTLVDAVGLLS